MNSKSTLHRVIVTFTAFTAVSGVAPTTWADTVPAHVPAHVPADVPVKAPAEAPADGSAEFGPQHIWEAPVVRTGTWRTSARPRVAHRPQSSKGFALDQVVQRAWPLREFRCLDALWTRESGWNHRAHNPSSGAYGIPQALPAGKMRGAGPDWRHNPQTQIRWGLSYIKGRYGRPCGAWGHFKSHNWY
ncbi:aggregation-promoting factor C-terminal-like domain-containing protein [Nonomuraea glycinis]|uniref:aggregation-promoting factor C-terminal-like domain-containing protein n=1 Tax=Nonomuraea glycinis TaxID=2047744 RepID=UPI002E121F74|nr:transglycosylase SLT domain-containing protein [Nonomuraea glycinis]